MENNLTSRLDNLNALVCGATSGIGKATAIEFAELGANVTLFARNEDKLKDTLNLLKNDENQSHQILVGDFDNSDQIKSIIEHHIKDGNNYHILINNSGGPKGGLITVADTNEFLQGFNRHLICNHILFQSLFEGMKANGYGRIINIISTSVKQPIPGLGVSNTIRGAVASWAKTLSFEIANHGITVNNILPGFTDTERLSSLISAKASTENISTDMVAETMKSTVPSKRFGTPEETAKAIAFLASPSASYINGVSLAVDGGRLSCI
ncbi:MAG: SDR family oxidoreductase [Candidatus Marinimicrobia bacterium]|nr:SDR family oxidoreductase [Candidatus Neomarinimicrobiota bacterium]